MSKGDGPTPGKIFVGGLAPETDSASLSEFFSQFGAVAKSDVVMTNDKMSGRRRSRGFGFVIFEDVHVVDDVLMAGPSMPAIDGKHVEVKRHDETKSAAKGGGFSSKSSRGEPQREESPKIFVGGLPELCDDTMLRNYFVKIDPSILEARVMTDPRSGRSRRFGYVTFSAGHFARKALNNRANHYIDNQWVEVKECVPMGVDKPDRSKGGLKGGPRGDRGDRNRGGGRKGDDPYDMFSRDPVGKGRSRDDRPSASRGAPGMRYLPGRGSPGAGALGDMFMPGQGFVPPGADPYAAYAIQAAAQAAAAQAAAAHGMALPGSFGNPALWGMGDAGPPGGAYGSRGNGPAPSRKERQRYTLGR